MAKSDSTTRAPAQYATPPRKLGLDFYNPLITDNNPEDTLIRVGAVLEFLSEITVRATDEEGAAIIYQAWGLSLVLDTCRTALQNVQTKVEAHHE
ncbi:MAG: hypothetical protein K2P67_07180 [Gallionellaceae bacterium]|nr:hypothetical protein [Gallionellaceae bacterium]